MKRLIAAGIIALVLVSVGTVFLANKYLTAQSNAASPADAKCQAGKHNDHIVLIKNNAMVPERTEASLCDKLTIVNKDPTLRLVAFGPHEHHVAYDGVTERPLEPGESLTIVLIHAGTYAFHDHLEDIAQGSFTVAE
ncbi:MAG TPA: hypothetical protein VFC50_02350 [Candidatus Dormibacteraeota bacterium]|nr:hypothetical protein [Candidatus Dormibacteraeota bacterium]